MENERSFANGNSMTNGNGPAADKQQKDSGWLDIIRGASSWMLTLGMLP
jgi:hypothetical protein